MLIWNQRHLLHALREFEEDTPLTPRPVPIADPGRIARLDVRGRDRLGGTLHEYRRAA
jgi:hypothetical protein